MQIEELFEKKIAVDGNVLIVVADSALPPNQKQTKEIFKDKWEKFDRYEKADKLYEFQFEWFLSLYGFSDVDTLREYLSEKKLIVDTGCGLGYKAAWLAELAPHAKVIGIDISEACMIAARNYIQVPNLYFMQDDIAATALKDRVVDFMVCDQVIMHTEHPEKTFAHLASKTCLDGEFACYFYRKKALPRELIDDYFRGQAREVSSEELWEFSEQVTLLGQRLSEIDAEIECPEIPLLGIKEGTYPIQRFIYWNFLKCFWKEDWGFDLSKSTNFDWYAPSNAKRFSKEEVLALVDREQFEVRSFHEEEACYSGRFGHCR